MTEPPTAVGKEGEESEPKRAKRSPEGENVAKVHGQVTVAKYFPYGQRPPHELGVKSVIIHTPGPYWGNTLSPYVLKNELGQLLENVWQFSKIYKKVDAQKIHLSSKHPNSRVIWAHPEEVHLDESGNPTPAYWAWREKGMNNPYAVRYPNGFHGRKRCVSTIVGTPEKFRRLDYIAARKEVYCGEYARLTPHCPEFVEMKQMLAEGKSLQICEVDGPDPKLKYPPYNKLTKYGLVMDQEAVTLLVNDPKRPFGHGFVLAALLLGLSMQ